MSTLLRPPRLVMRRGLDPGFKKSALKNSLRSQSLRNAS